MAFEDFETVSVGTLARRVYENPLAAEEIATEHGKPSCIKIERLSSIPIDILKENHMPELKKAVLTNRKAEIVLDAVILRELDEKKIVEDMPSIEEVGLDIDDFDTFGDAFCEAFGAPLGEKLKEIHEEGRLAIIFKVFPSLFMDPEDIPSDYATHPWRIRYAKYAFTPTEVLGAVQAAKRKADAEKINDPKERLDTIQNSFFIATQFATTSDRRSSGLRRDIAGGDPNNLIARRKLKSGEAFMLAVPANKCPVVHNTEKESYEFYDLLRKIVYAGHPEKPYGCPAVAQSRIIQKLYKLAVPALDKYELLNPQA